MKCIALFGAIALVAAAATAHDYQLRSLGIDHPFARATPAGARAGGVYLTVENTGRVPDRLIGATSPVAGTAELHQMTLDGGIMRMREVQALDVKAGAKLELKPGGYHLMLGDLKRPLKVGDRFPLTLTFEHAGAIEVMISVEAIDAKAMPER